MAGLMQSIIFRMSLEDREALGFSPIEKVPPILSRHEDDDRGGDAIAAVPARGGLALLAYSVLVATLFFCRRHARMKECVL